MRPYAHPPRIGWFGGRGHLDHCRADADPDRRASGALDCRRPRARRRRRLQRTSSPAEPRSAVDGYAVRAADNGARLLLGEIWPGRLASSGRAGQAVRIMTGGVVPARRRRRGDGRGHPRGGRRRRDPSSRPRAGDNVQAIGIDLERGQVVATAGQRLGAAEIGLLATIGAGARGGVPAAAGGGAGDRRRGTSSRMRRPARAASATATATRCWRRRARPAARSISLGHRPRRRGRCSAPRSWMALSAPTCC